MTLYPPYSYRPHYSIYPHTVPRVSPMPHTPTQTPVPPLPLYPPCPHLPIYPPTSPNVPNPPQHPYIHPYTHPPEISTWQLWGINRGGHPTAHHRFGDTGDMTPFTR